MNKINIVNKSIRIMAFSASSSKNFRIHIAPVGFDPVQRITLPLIEQRADRVYLISRSKQGDPASGIVKQVQEALARHPSIEVKHVYAEIWDLFSCLEKYRDIFHSEGEGNHIYVNVSTGSKVLAMAGMLSCMLWDGTPYYAKLDYEVGGPDKGPDKRKVTGTDILPVFQIHKPSSESLQVLSIINNKGGKMSKKDLIERLQMVKLMPDLLPSQAKSAPHSRLRAILGPLELQWRFVEVNSKGRRSDVVLTGQGKNALRIFGSGRVE